MALLQQTDVALKRIESDKYGLGRVCNEPITLCSGFKINRTRPITLPTEKNN